MQSQLKGSSIWRAFALTLSASALTLALCGRTVRSQKPVVRGDPPATDTTGHSDAESTAIVQSSGLRENGDAAALEALIAIAERGEPRLLSGALEGIAQIGGDRAREFLARHFEAATDAELPAFASALATVGDDRARAMLRAAAGSARSATRSAAFDALSSLDTADVREFMVRALNSTDPLPAASYFLNCREPRAISGLEQAARSGDSDLTRVALDALFAQGASAEAAIDRLLREDDELCDALLEGQPPTLSARKALRRVSIARMHAGALTSERVFEFLQRDLSSEARDALVEAAHDPTTRQSALAALSARGDSGSLRALSALANDNEPGLAEHAACALLSQPDSRSQPHLLRSNGGHLREETAAALLRINAPGGRSI